MENCFRGRELVEIQLQAWNIWNNLFVLSSCLTAVYQAMQQRCCRPATCFFIYTVYIYIYIFWLCGFWVEGQPRWIAKHIHWMRTATFQPTAVPIFSQLFPKRSVQWTPMLGSHAFLHPIELVSPLRMPPLSNVQSASSFLDAQVPERSQHRKTSSHPPPPCPKINDWWSFDDNSNPMTMLWHPWQVTLSQMWDLLAGKMAQTCFFWFV